MDYRDLCQVLLNSCADWTSEEKSVVKKILKAMGVTVVERRTWLARLRQSLMEADATITRKHGKWFDDPVDYDDYGYRTGASSKRFQYHHGIPPAAFLHCLRECGVNLTVDEEATLLDCLDTERLAK